MGEKDSFRSDTNQTVGVGGSCREFFFMLSVG